MAQEINHFVCLDPYALFSLCCSSQFTLFKFFFTGSASILQLFFAIVIVFIGALVLGFLTGVVVTYCCVAHRGKYNLQTREIVASYQHSVDSHLTVKNIAYQPE